MKTDNWNYNVDVKVDKQERLDTILGGRTLRLCRKDENLSSYVSCHNFAVLSKNLGTSITIISDIQSEGGEYKQFPLESLGLDRYRIMLSNWINLS